MGEYTAPFNALAHVLDGAVDITISGYVYWVSAGEMIIIPGNELHAVEELK